MRWSRLVLLCCLLPIWTPVLGQGSSPPRPTAEYRALNLLGTTGLMLSPTAYLQRDGEASLVGAGLTRARTGDWRSR